MDSACSFHQTSVEQAENLIRQHEVFVTTLDANDDKINNVLNMGQRLINENNYMSKSVQQKIESLKERLVPKRIWQNSVLLIIFHKIMNFFMCVD